MTDLSPPTAATASARPAMTAEIAAVHAGAPEAPAGLAALLRSMIGDMEVHMKKEELILFPAIRQGGGPGIDQPIAVMRADHDDHTAEVTRIRQFTRDLTLPVGACRKWTDSMTVSARSSSISRSTCGSRTTSCSRSLRFAPGRPEISEVPARRLTMSRKTLLSTLLAVAFAAVGLTADRHGRRVQVMREAGS